MLYERHEIWRRRIARIGIAILIALQVALIVALVAIASDALHACVWFDWSK